MRKLVASLIVRNEFDRYLELAVGHLQTFCSEIRVLDDGSDDGSYEWLADQERVFVKRNEGPAFFEHEGRARQALLEWTIEGQPEYVLSIDADEFVGDPGQVQQMVGRGLPGGSLLMEEVWGASETEIRVRTDGLWKPHHAPILWRAPRALRGGLWEIKDSKLACGREPLEVRRMRVRPTGTSVFHFGWARRAERERRAARYAEHDGGRFHLDRHLQSILWPDEKVTVLSRPWPPGLQALSAKIAERAGRPMPSLSSAP